MFSSVELTNIDTNIMPLIVSDLCMLRYQCARPKLGPDTIQDTNSSFSFCKNTSLLVEIRVLF